MNIVFTKMHALGNDFVVINTIRYPISITATLMRHIANRHYGIGCDQILLITPTDNPKADFGYRIFNADGSEVYQCGNGARCVGLFIQNEKLANKKIISLETKNSVMRVECLLDNQIQVDIAIPNFNPASLPFITTEKNAPYHLSLQKQTIEFDIVSVGNPHCIIFVDDIDMEKLIDIGKQLNHHTAFPEGVNVSFVKVQSPDTIKLSVYERGTGITQACGSGACAAVAVGQAHGYLHQEVKVQQSGGFLQVIRQSPDAMMQLCGTANFVFNGIAHF